MHRMVVPAAERGVDGQAALLPKPSRLWLALCMAVVLVAAASGQELRNLVNNGDFSQWQGNLPTYWDSSTYRGAIKMWKDTADFHSAPASLGIVRNVWGPGEGLTQPFRTRTRLPGPPGSTFVVDVWVKLDSYEYKGMGQLLAQFSCLATDWADCPKTASFPYGGWMVAVIVGSNVNNACPELGVWTHVVDSGVVHEGAKYGSFMIYQSGTVSWHIDDLKVTCKGEYVDIADPFEDQPVTPLRPVMTMATVSHSKELRVYLPSGRHVDGARAAQTPGLYLVRTPRAPFAQMVPCVQPAP